MAFSGFLIKLGGSSGIELPMEYMAVESYKCTPNQRMESKATRSVTGLLQRTTVSHTATKIEFETPHLTNKQRSALNTLFTNAFTDSLQRKLTIYYYDDETDTYKTADVYMPDVQYTIDHIDLTKNIIFYKPVRYAFIEY